MLAGDSAAGAAATPAARSRPGHVSITFKLFASLTRYLPPAAVRNIVQIEIAATASVYDVLDSYHVPRESAHLVLINGVYILPEDRARPIFAEGDAFAVWPPVAGG